jgi:hypothetical protein
MTLLEEAESTVVSRPISSARTSESAEIAQFLADTSIAATSTATPSLYEPSPSPRWSNCDSWSPSSSLVNASSSSSDSSCSTFSSSDASEMANKIESLLSKPTAVKTSTSTGTTTDANTAGPLTTTTKVSVGTQMNKVTSTLSDLGLPLDPVEANIYILGKELRCLALCDKRVCLESIQLMTKSVKELTSGLTKDPDTSKFYDFLDSC